MAAEDFGLFYNDGKIPSVLLYVGSAKPGVKDAASVHSPKFKADYEPTIQTGIRTVVSASLELLKL